MEEHGTPDQYWVRTEAGQVMGPLTYVTVEMLAAQGVFGRVCEVSLDGVLFAPVGEMPAVRDAFPHSMWGEEDVRLDAGEAELELEMEPASLVEGDLGAAELDAALDLATAPAPTLEIDGLDDLVLDVPAPAPVPAPPRAPIAPPPAPRVHAAPAGERVHAAPVGEPALRAFDAPQGAFAPRDAPDPVVEGMVLPELIPAGRLLPGTAIRLYYLVAATRSTGLLQVVPPDGGAFGIFFKKGKPEQVRIDDPRHSLASHLVRAGKITAEKALEAEAAKGRFGGEVVNALFALGLLDPSQAFAVLAEHGRTALEQALLIHAGNFTWNPKAPVPNGTMPLGAALALLGAAGRAVDPAVAFGRLGSRIDCPVMRAGDGLAGMEELALSAVEARIAAAFDGTRSLAEIATASPADASLVYRLGWFLGEVGFASFAMAVRPRPANAPLLGPAPPAADEIFTDPELDMLAAPMPPPGTIAPPGVDTGGPRNAVSFAPKQVPAVPTITPGPPVIALTPGPRLAPTLTPGPRLATTLTPGPRLAPTPGPGAAALPRPAGTPGPAAARAAAAATERMGSAFAPSPSPFAPPSLGRATTRTPGPPPARPPAPAAPPLDAASLRKLLDRMLDQDHFMAMGLTRSATSAQVKQAFLKLAREHHPDTAGAGAPPDVRKLKEQITARLNEANQEIGDDAARADYLASLAAGGGGKQVDLSSILAAEESFNMAAILVKARKYADALVELDKAIDLNGAEGEFYAWRGFARFSAAEDKRAVQADALADVRKALELNERCAVAHLFAGRMALVLANPAEATRSLRKCLDLDPQNIEAQRELRLLESRTGR